jgi:hypothetical protein
MDFQTVNNINHLTLDLNEEYIKGVGKETGESVLLPLIVQRQLQELLHWPKNGS